ncbi:MAG TPA: GNAT family N-acyltransferase [Thermodesulfovibrionales bacterium]|jgi:putative hemolysin|nr:GNAT family N-acyltransferase [Thermodesulfovibrionales bacterium]
MRADGAGMEISHGRFSVKLAVENHEREAAFRLRFDVFNRELHEGLSESYLTGMDRDEFDDYCDHLVVVDRENERVVGTYRMMPGVVAENSVGYYSETEFNLSAIRSLPGTKLELGRSCIHKDYRTVPIIGLLWRGIAAYVERYGIRYLFGCASLHSANTALVNIVYSYLNRVHRADERYTVDPLKRQPGVQMLSFCDRDAAHSLMPTLMKGYLRLGAQICGEPTFNPLFGTTDFFVLLDTDRLIERWRRKVLREGAEHACAA